MKRHLAAASALLVLLACAYCNGARAQAPPFIIERDGVVQFGANALQHDPASPVYNFCEVPANCGVTPPPNDPGAYTSLVVTWLQTPPVSVTTDVTQFFNLFGHIKPSLPVQQWPGVSGTTVKYQDGSTKYVRLRLSMPLNPGTLSHFLKLVSYGTTPGAVVRMAVVPAGAPWPTGAATACFVPHAVNDQPALHINPGAANRSKCSVAAGSVVDVLVDTAPNGWIALSFN